MYVRTIQHLTTVDKNLKQQFAVYYSHTPVTLKQIQGHQTCYELVDHKQGYNYAQFEKPRLNSVRESANNNFVCVCQIRKNVNDLP